MKARLCLIADSKMKSKYKLLVVDMDGTLLNDQKQISPLNLEYISRARAEGVKIVVASGRPYKSILRFNELLKIDTPIINNNGSNVNDPESGKELLSYHIPADDVRRIYDMWIHTDTMLFAWVGGDLYASKTDLPERYYLSLGGVKEPKKLNSPDDIIPLGVKKMLWYGTPEIIEDLAAQIDPATLPGTLFVKPEPALLDFINKNASKGNALRQVAEMLGIDREEIIAIGDGCNDIPMLEFAGLSAAPATAMQEALAVADYIAPSNNENAIAHLISKFILGEEL